MKPHECLTCGDAYECTRDECGSPFVSESFCCYFDRNREEIEVAWTATELRLHERRSARLAVATYDIGVARLTATPGAAAAVDSSVLKSLRVPPHISSSP